MTIGQKLKLVGIGDVTVGSSKSAHLGIGIVENVKGVVRVTEIRQLAIRLFLEVEELFPGRSGLPVNRFARIIHDRQKARTTGYGEGPHEQQTRRSGAGGHGNRIHRKVTREGLIVLRVNRRSLRCYRRTRRQLLFILFFDHRHSRSSINPTRGDGKTCAQAWEDGPSAGPQAVRDRKHDVLAGREGPIWSKYDRGVIIGYKQSAGVQSAHGACDTKKASGE